MPSRFRLLVLAQVTGLALLAATDAAGADSSDLFMDRVEPLLRRACLHCHGPDRQEGALRLDSREALLKGGESGPAVVPGNPDESLLLHAVHGRDGRKMPPKEHLAPAEIGWLTTWVAHGAPWPVPALALFEDDAELPEALNEGSGSAQMDGAAPFAGATALVVSGQRLTPQVAGWNLRITEHPAAGEYRYLRFAWKKRGGGGMMFEVAHNAAWRRQTQEWGAWVAGQNHTGWSAVPIADVAPAEWTVVTRDLWQDGKAWGDWRLTGLCITALDGGEACLDSIVLAPSLESLNAYRPGRGLGALGSRTPSRRIGPAATDPTNPVAQKWGGERLDLWSLVTPRPPVVPVDASNWSRTDVDRIVIAGLMARGLAPSPEAGRLSLLRRLSFDLTGLPPTPAECQAFLADVSVDAHARVVDRLLNSPSYGEHWARHWLDLARYADTDGHERDEFRPEMYRYRDYVIRSFNADKPYDQFVTEQLAGDELLSGPPGNAAEQDALLATGFLRLGQYDSTATLFQEDAKARNELMGDLANTTGSVFLGLTFSCANCHDHKYDPILQVDHFRLRAFFSGVARRDDLPIDLADEQRAIQQHNDRVTAQIQGLSDQQQSALRPVWARAVALNRRRLPSAARRCLRIAEKSLTESERGLRSEVAAILAVTEEFAVSLLPPAQSTAFQQRLDSAKQLASSRRTYTHAHLATEQSAAAPPVHLLFQGDVHEPRELVEPGYLSALDPNPAVITPPPAANSSGRRLALARWIASPDNPLTARVMVNRIWQRHFGEPLNGTPNDFGHAGQRPTHPELLDYLALEFIRSGWSIKHMHRLVALSSVYKQTSAPDAAREALDPHNRGLWRQNVRRLSAEGIRDNLLSVSGVLSADGQGPPRWPAVPLDILHSIPGILEGLEGKDEGRRQGWYTDTHERTLVRSVFLIQKRALPLPFLQAFDLPDCSVSCGRRDVTTVAPQALSLLNNELVARLADAFARRVRDSAGTDVERCVESAFWLAVQRPPSSTETQLACDLLRRHAELHATLPDPPFAALVDLARVLFNINEFVYVD